MRWAQEAAAWRRRRALRQGPAANALAQLQKTGSVFVHVPKCGGKSVIRDIYGLAEHDWFGHAPVAYYRALLGPSAFDKAVKFAVVREPVARCLSGFRFYAAGGFGLPNDRAVQARLEGLDFDSFVAGGHLADLMLRDVVFRPQASFVFLPEGRLGVDHLCRFEAFDADLAALPGRLARTGRRSRVNVTAGAAPEVAAETAAQIRTLYAEDYARFAALGPLAPPWSGAGLAPSPTTV